MGQRVGVRLVVIIAGAVLALIGAYVMWPSSDAYSLATLASGTSVGAIRAAQAESSNRPPSLAASQSKPPSQQQSSPLSPYLERRNIRVLVNAALGSGNAEQLWYARLYVQRCSESATWARGVPRTAWTSYASESVSKAVEGFDKMCDFQNFETEQIRLSRALKYELERADQKLAGNAPATSSYAPPAEKLGEGEAALAKYTNDRLLGKTTAFDSIGSCGQGSEQAMLCDLVVQTVVCRNLGCDLDYQMAKICGLFHECSGGSMDEQVNTLFAKAAASASGRGAVKVAPSELWQQMVARAQAVVTTKRY